MADDAIPEAQRTWQEFDTPTLTLTLLDAAGAAIPSANIVTLTLSQWVEQGPNLPGKVINSRNAQSVLNLHNVTVHSTSGLVTWSLQPADTTFVSRDKGVIEETHHFLFKISYTASAATVVKSYRDSYTIQRAPTVA